MKANGPDRKIFDAVDVLTEEAPAVNGDGVQMISVEKIRPFKDHPFRLYEGERLNDMVASVKEHRILSPVIVRTISREGQEAGSVDGSTDSAGKGKGRKRNGGAKHEMLLGHNRLNAAKIAGVSEIPAIVKDDLPDDLAYVYVIETNLMQRSFSDLLPSEKAAVLKEQYDKVCGTMKRQEIIKELEALSGKTFGSGGHNGHQVKSRDIVASEYGFSSRNAARFLRINYLIAPFKAMIDENMLALLAAVDLSYLPEDKQQAVWNLADRQGLKIKPKTAEALRKNEGNLTEEKIAEILDAMSVKRRSGNEGVSLKLPDSICQKYFSGMAAAQMTEIVEKALEAWFAEQSA